MRAAVVGGVAYHAGKKRATAGQAEEEAPPQSEQPPAPVAQPASGDDTVTQLTKLKELLDAGALTQAEFDAQKQKILAAS
jgi:hypothetical protein